MLTVMGFLMIFFYVCIICFDHIQLFDVVSCPWSHWHPSSSQNSSTSTYMLYLFLNPDPACEGEKYMLFILKGSYFTYPDDSQF